MVAREVGGQRNTVECSNSPTLSKPFLIIHWVTLPSVLVVMMFSDLSSPAWYSRSIHLISQTGPRWLLGVSLLSRI